MEFRRVLFRSIHPTRKGALAKATHAISLILPDQRPLFLRDKDKRVVWRLESAGIAKTKPLPRTQQVTARHPEIPPFDADIKLMLVITRRFSGKGDLPLRPAFQIAKERIANRRGINRSEEHTSELQSLMRISYAVFCLTKK